MQSKGLMRKNKRKFIPCSTCGYTFEEVVNIGQCASYVQAFRTTGRQHYNELILFSL